MRDELKLFYIFFAGYYCLSQTKIYDCIIDFAVQSGDMMRTFFLRLIGIWNQ